MHRLRPVGRWAVAALAITTAGTLSAEATAKPTLAALRDRVRNLFQRTGGIDDALLARVKAARAVAMGGCTSYDVRRYSREMTYAVPRRNELLALARPIAELTRRIENARETLLSARVAMNAQMALSLLDTPGFSDAYAFPGEREIVAAHNSGEVCRLVMSRQRVENQEPPRAMYEQMVARGQFLSQGTRTEITFKMCDDLQQREVLRTKALAVVNMALSEANLPWKMTSYGAWHLVPHRNYHPPSESSPLDRHNWARGQAGQRVSEALAQAEARPYGYQWKERAKQQKAVQRLTAAVSALEELTKSRDTLSEAIQEARSEAAERAIRQVWSDLFSITREKDF